MSGDPYRVLLNVCNNYVRSTDGMAAPPIANAKILEFDSLPLGMASYEMPLLPPFRSFVIVINGGQPLVAIYCACSGSVEAHKIRSVGVTQTEKGLWALFTGTMTKTTGDDWTLHNECDSWIIDPDGKPISELVDESAKRLICFFVLRSIRKFSDPTNTIVELSPAKPRKYRPGQVPHHHQRIRYVALPRIELRRLADRAVSPGGHAIISPHWRRAHWRRLDSDRFSEERRGTYVPVRACTVGGQKEFIIGATRYRIRLDIAGHAPSREPGSQAP